jgi:CspA family cold shock protein
MKRFVLFLVTLGAVSLGGSASGRAQVLVDEPPAEAAPKMKDEKSYHEAMCNRMCVQLGKSKKSQVCGNNKKTYNNACSAKCAKVAYKRGPCPEEEKKEEAPAIIALDEEAVQAQIEAEEKRPGGEVKWFDWDKGEGAIVADDGKELYVDAAAVTGDAVETLKQGDRVKFDITQGPKGMHAAKVALELTEKEKEAKLEEAATLEFVEARQFEASGAPKELMRESKSDDGVYVLP